MKGIKRYKVTCNKCGSTFNSDYKNEHEKKVHKGDRVSVTTVGAPKNPFELAAKRKKIIDTDTADTQIPAATCSSNSGDQQQEPQKDCQNPATDSPHVESVRIESQLEETISNDLSSNDDQTEHANENVLKENITEKSPEPDNRTNNGNGGTKVTSKNNNVSGTEENDMNFNLEPQVMSCAGELNFFADFFQFHCESILRKWKETVPVDIPSFLAKTQSFLKDCISKSEKILEKCEAIQNDFDLVHQNTIYSNEASDSIIDRDPGKRQAVETDNQRNFLISLGPFQPQLPRFPETDGQRFNANWYKEYSFLEYSIEKDAAFCFVCALFRTGPGREKRANTWITNGCSNWRKMKGKKGKFDKHFGSKAHRASLDDYRNYIRSKASPHQPSIG